MDKHDIAKIISKNFNARVRKWIAREQFEIDTGVTFTISAHDAGWTVSGVKSDGSKEKPLTISMTGELKV